MTAEEREAFLAGVHVGVLAVERDGRAPLAVPVWYDKYVTVEGPVVANEKPPTREQALAIVERYLPEEEVAGYVDGALGKDTVLVRVRPERWLSSDHGKLDQS